MKKFLIVKPSSLGDILHAFPAVSALCRLENARADWMIHPAFAGLLPYLPCVDRAILFERSRLGSLKTFVPEYFKLRRELKRERYDAVIDLQGLARSAYFGWVARSKIHAGPASPREGFAGLFYSKRLTSTPGKHALLRNNEAICSFLGRNDIDFTFEMPSMAESAASVKKMLDDAGVPENAVLIGLAPGARWVTKQWPPVFFASVISTLAKRIPGAAFVLTGGKTDTAASAEIREKCSVPDQVFDLCGKTSLGELVEFTRICRLFICNDSGPMHIAAALNTPVLALFGPTSPELTGPFTERKRVLQPDLDCLRCFRRVCETGKCHTGIDPVLAADAAFELMKKFS